MKYRSTHNGRHATPFDTYCRYIFYGYTHPVGVGRVRESMDLDIYTKKSVSWYEV